MPHFTDFSTFPIRDHFSKYYKTKISILFWNFSPHLKIPIRITLRQKQKSKKAAFVTGFDDGVMRK
jgi:hypothetical protein